MKTGSRPFWDEWSHSSKISLMKGESGIRQAGSKKKTYWNPSRTWWMSCVYTYRTSFSTLSWGLSSTMQLLMPSPIPLRPLGSWWHVYQERSLISLSVNSFHSVLCKSKRNSDMAPQVLGRQPLTHWYHQIPRFNGVCAPFNLDQISLSLLDLSILRGCLGYGGPSVSAISSFSDI